MVILETNMGEIHINVDAEKAPITTKNFIDYVEDGFLKVLFSTVSFLIL